MRKPKPLKPGDTIAFVSPASPVLPEKIEPARALLEAAGYRIKVMPNAHKEHGFLAGTDEERASDLQQAFDDPEVQAILCTRGGYGAARLLPHLNLDGMAASGKMFLGFSDITTLHLALNRRGLVTFHSPMALTFVVDREQWVAESLLNALQGQNQTPPGAPTGETITGGTAEGIVTGGCLCLLTDSLATPDALDCDGKIILIEDVDENPHRIDAMLTHLINAGQIQKAAGIVMGEMTGTDDKSDASIGSMPWRGIVEERLGFLNIPMIVNYPFGHCKNMLTLPLGIRARLDANEGTLTYLESACA